MQKPADLLRRLSGRECVADAHLALSEPYNLLLYGAVLGYIEEEELEWSAWLKLKKLIESDRQTIRPMQRNTFQATNYLHFVITTNHLDSLPIQGVAGESRIVFIDVPEIPEERRRDFNANDGEQALKDENRDLESDAHIAPSSGCVVVAAPNARNGVEPPVTAPNRQTFESSKR